jgi:hypothetical protein
LLNPVGLAYRLRGIDYLVPDIFVLGAPCAFSIPDAPTVEPSTGTTVASGEEPDTLQTEQATPAPPESPAAEPAPAHVSATAFTLPRAGSVVIDVFTVTGRLVRTVEMENLSAGAHDAPWDGRDDGGRRVPSGIYLYRISGPGLNTVRKLFVVR